MLISLTNLAVMHKIQKNIWTKVRLVGPININTKEWQNKPPFMKVVYSAIQFSLFTIKKKRQFFIFETPLEQLIVESNWKEKDKMSH